LALHSIAVELCPFYPLSSDAHCAASICARKLRGEPDRDLAHGRAARAPSAVDEERAKPAAVDHATCSIARDTGRRCDRVKAFQFTPS